MSFDLLEKARALDVFSHHVLVPEEGHRTLSFLSSLLDPFLQGYQVTETHGRCSKNTVLGAGLGLKIFFLI